MTRSNDASLGTSLALVIAIAAIAAIAAVVLVPRSDTRRAAQIARAGDRLYRSAAAGGYRRSASRIRDGGIDRDRRTVRAAGAGDDRRRAAARRPAAAFAREAVNRRRRAACQTVARGAGGGFDAA